MVSQPSLDSVSYVVTTSQGIIIHDRIQKNTHRFNPLTEWKHWNHTDAGLENALKTGMVIQRNENEMDYNLHNLWVNAEDI